MLRVSAQRWRSVDTCIRIRVNEGIPCGIKRELRSLKSKSPQDQNESCSLKTRTPHGLKQGRPQREGVRGGAHVAGAEPPR
jgi:hypothetical protein